MLPAAQVTRALSGKPRSDGMMARMPDLSRRAVLRLGVGAAAGAVGAYTVGGLLNPGPPSPVRRWR